MLPDDVDRGIVHGQWSMGGGGGVGGAEVWKWEERGSVLGTMNLICDL